MAEEADQPEPYEQLAYSKYNKIKKKLPSTAVGKVSEVEDEIADNPQKGELKKGDLAGWWVYKFRLMGHQNLLAYKVNEDKGQIIFGGLGIRENFYRDFKRYLKSHR